MPPDPPVEYECTGALVRDGVRVSHWRPRPAVSLWLTGRTRQGRTVEILGDPYVDSRAVVKIEGVHAEVRCVDRKRDGGTTVVETDRGTVVRPTPFRPDLYPTLDGKALLA
jgi:hypothetical protein